MRRLLAMPCPNGACIGAALLSDVPTWSCDAVGARVWRIEYVRCIATNMTYLGL